MGAPSRFSQARISFNGEDTRERYPKPRYITVGTRDDRMVVMVGATRGEAHKLDDIEV
ncbi:protein of unknown function [Cupriavidus neocaledonicus]|uniref:Uncharacterized protein n=1 Tax=Cupriavidus neocaledonicus TaxID=1040979 RepID=A0A375H6Q0_9BURK|nr:hypothetical protein CBM2605_A230123 [Cupriavidus neocaledonicus]SPD47834.1 protein of unknown function [Cupriavidus neocaledonicus]